MKRLIIFDVDGTLTKTKSGETFRKTADDWEFLPGRLERCKELTEQGVALGLASNQGGVCFAWSKFTEEEIGKEIIRTGIAIGATWSCLCCSSPNEKALPKYFNPNDPRRKPNPGMLKEILEASGIAKEDALFVGDREEDREAARRAGIDFQWAEDFFA